MAGIKLVEVSYRREKPLVAEALMSSNGRLPLAAAAALCPCGAMPALQGAVTPLKAARCLLQEGDTLDCHCTTG